MASILKPAKPRDMKTAGEHTEGEIRFRMSGFSAVGNRGRTDPDRKLMIRFTLTWLLDCGHGRLGVDMEGCLMWIRDRKLTWTPPMSRSGRMYMSSVFVSEDLHELVLKALSGTKYAERLKAEWDETLLSAIDPEYPEELTI